MTAKWPGKPSRAVRPTCSRKWACWLLSGPIPNDPNLKGLNILMQAVSLGLAGTHLTNPAVVEFK